MKNVKELIKKMDKKVLIGAVALIVVVVLLLVFMPRTVKVTKEEVLLDGFTSKETITIKLSRNKVKNIKLTKEISLSEYYDEFGTYYDSLEKVLNNGYSYLDNNYNLKREDYKMIVNVDTKEKGIVLNNLTIKYNGDDKTTLRYDIETDLTKEESINIGEKISKSSLKKRLDKYGYK